MPSLSCHKTARKIQTEQIAGTTYAGITETYTIYSQQPGDFHIRPAEIAVKYANAPPNFTVTQLHDMGEPVSAASHIRTSLKPNGTWMVDEPFANDCLEQNLNPIGRIFYTGSTMSCTPASRAQEGAMCLGSQVGENRIHEVVNRGGFTRFRRATETEFNLIYVVRP